MAQTIKLHGGPSVISTLMLGHWRERCQQGPSNPLEISLVAGTTTVPADRMVLVVWCVARSLPTLTVSEPIISIPPAQKEPRNHAAEEYAIMHMSPLQHMGLWQTSNENINLREITSRPTQDTVSSCD